jgi:hypothetical protein
VVPFETAADNGGANPGNQESFLTFCLAALGEELGWSGYDDMHLSRLTPRFTVRRLMFAVAIIGSALGITIERRERFRWIAAHHRAEVPKHMPRIKPFGMEDKQWRLMEWHELMAHKYEHAARYPWLPVAPDRPEPR